MAGASTERLAQEFPAGHVLFEEGDPGECMYVVHTGAVELRRMLGGVSHPVAVLRQGEFFGEMAVLLGTTRTASAVVLEPSRIITIHAPALEGLLRDRAEVAVRMLQTFAQRLARANQQIELLLNPSASHRVAQYVRRLGEACGDVTAEGVFVATDARNIAIAVGADVNAVEDALRLLQDAGLAFPAERQGRFGLMVPELVLL